MKTTAILATALAAFLLSSGPTFAAEPGEAKPQAQTQTKKCYRKVHKLPYRIRVKCPVVKVPMSETVNPVLKQTLLSQTLALGERL